MITLSRLLEQKERRICKVAPTAPVIDAIRVMAQDHVGALLVMEGDALVGIVSERDYARKVVLMGRGSSDTAVSEIMSSPVETLGPDASVEDAMRAMTEKRIRHLPVTQGGRVLGVVSIGDLVKSVIDDQRHLIEDLTSYIRG
jgi:CBS domain-containing protein